MTARKTASTQELELAKELGNALLETIETWARRHKLSWKEIRRTSRTVLLSMVIVQPPLNPAVSGKGDS